MQDCHHACRKLKLDKVGVTNGVLRGISDLTSLDELLLPNSHRVTDVGLSFFSKLINLRYVHTAWGYCHNCLYVHTADTQ